MITKRDCLKFNITCTVTVGEDHTVHHGGQYLFLCINESSSETFLYNLMTFLLEPMSHLAML